MSPFDPRAVLDQLRGKWEYERRIDDHYAGEVLTVTGTAVFTPNDDGGLDYVESGTLTTPSGSSSVERRLSWRVIDGGFSLWFGNGLPFVELTFVDGVASSPHPCKEDSYTEAVDLRGLDGDSPEWVETWEVHGPAKDYSAVATFRRQP